MDNIVSFMVLYLATTPFLFFCCTKFQAYSLMAMACWLLVFVWVWWLPFMFDRAKEQQGEGCSAKRCGNLTISHPFWLTDLETGASCGSLDFELNCNNSIPVFRSFGSTGDKVALQSRTS